MPVVALFFPIEVAIAITAIVHLANNAFKVALLGKYANVDVLVRFGLTAIVFAFIGAQALNWLATAPTLYEYQAFDTAYQVAPIKFVVGILILSFVLIELSSISKRIQLSKSWLPIGGIISGFFGGRCI